MLDGALGRGVALEERDAMTGLRQPERSRESGNAAADDRRLHEQGSPVGSRESDEG